MKLRIRNNIYYEKSVIIDGVIPLSVNAQFQMGYCGKNLFYYFYPDTKELIIDGSGEMENYSPSNRAPWYDMGVKTVEICNTTNIGDYAFNGCTSLTEVAIPDSVTSIGGYTFYVCSSLTGITIPDSVTSIGDYVFRYCTNLKNLTLGSGLRVIRDKAFVFCQNLEKVICNAENAPSTCTETFRDSNIADATLIVPDSSIDLYKNAIRWNTFGTIMGTNQAASIDTPSISNAPTDNIYSLNGYKLPQPQKGINFINGKKYLVK